MNLVFGQDRAVAEWVARRIDEMDSGDEFGPCVAIGVAEGTTPIAGVVYHMYSRRWDTMQISVAAMTPRWAQKGIIYALLSYPFDQQGVRKLWSCINSSNERALRFNRGLGFKPEATMARQYGNNHAIITRMYDTDFRRIYGAKYAEAA